MVVSIVDLIPFCGLSLVRTEWEDFMISTMQRQLLITMKESSISSQSINGEENSIILILILKVRDILQLE
jgi:hypothetical protein